MQNLYLMNVLYLIEGDGGGAVTHVLTLAEQLMRKHNIATYVVFLLEGPSVKVAEELGLNCQVVHKRRFFDPMLLWRLSRILEERSVDIIHTHTIRGNFYGRMVAALCKRRRVVITSVHSHIVDEMQGEESFGIKEWLLWKREKLTWRRVDQFICVSNKLRGRLLSHGISGRKIAVIENGVELPDLRVAENENRSVREELSIDNDEIVVVTIGRLVPVKNHILFLKAAREVTRQKKNVRFLVVGDGVLLDSLRAKAKEWNLKERVIFAGWRNDVQRLLCATDIYVICSFVEGLNLSVLEAMAHAVAVVGTDVKGISDIVVNNETGMLVAVDDVGSLARAILTLANDKELSEHMGANGRRLIEDRYSMRRMVDDTVDLYRKSYSTLKERGVSYGA